MYILKNATDNKYITFICSPKFVKLTKNNCLGNASEYDADGIFHNGVLYEIAGRKNHIANSSCKINLEKVDDGTMLFYLYNQIEDIKNAETKDITNSEKTSSLDVEEGDGSGD